MKPDKRKLQTGGAKQTNLAQFFVRGPAAKKRKVDND